LGYWLLVIVWKSGIGICDLLSRRGLHLSTVRVRLGPSPTGYLHVGTARIALYNWLYAKQKDGTFILRIEDTDFARSSKDMTEKVLVGLEWLGLKWGEGPYYQSQRLELYSEYKEKLIQTDTTYYCYCSPEELASRKAATLRQKKPWKYDRKCLRLSADEREALDSKGVPKALRFRVAEGRTSFEDGVHGHLEKDNSDIEDFILVRSDGVPTYNFAVVIDDHDMGITHVIRGVDHLSNTFKQVLIFDALSLSRPLFYHQPLILAEDKSKLSKRHGAVSVMELKEAGYLPEALINFLALLGWSPGTGEEIFSTDDLIREFSFDRVIKRGAVFDREKLEWMNGQYINRMEPDELFDAALPFLKSGGLVDDRMAAEKREWIVKVLNLLKERARTLRDFVTLGQYFFADQFSYDEKGVKKHFSDADVGERLKSLRNAFSSASSYSKEDVETLLRGLAEKLGVKAARLIHPARMAVTGLQVGPGLFEIMELLGKERVVDRLDRAVEFIHNL